jgi:hypothetical protein
VGIGEDSEILAAIEDDVGKQQSFHTTEGVIGGDHGRAGCRNVLELAGCYFRGDIQFFQGQANEFHGVLTLGNGFVVPIQLPQAQDPINYGPEGCVQALYAGNVQAMAHTERIPGVNSV